MRKYGGNKYRRAALPTKQTGVWWALATGLAVALGLFVGVLIPLTGLVMSITGIGPFTVVPMGSVILLVALGYSAALLALAAILRVRRTPAAWLLSIFSMIVAFLASIYPAVAAAVSVADRVGGIIPAVGELWELLRQQVGW